MSRADSRLSTGTLVTYSLPSAAMGFMGLLVAIYLLKFATDVLLIPPATMGLLFGLSRLWDAVSDPICGYASDRTTSRHGRRRPWILAGVLPMAGAFVMLWSPPPACQGTALALWMGAAILLFYTGLTMVDVPHSALGAELTDDYHGRTRIFAVRRIVFGLGTLLAVAAIGAFDRLPDARATGALAGTAAALFALPVTAWMVVHTRERAEFRHRGARHPWQAFRDVWTNPHARRLLLVFTIQQLGIVSLTVVMPFYSEYVLGTPGSTFVYLGTMFLSSVLGIPLWIRLAPRVEKKRLLLLTMAVIFVAMTFLAFARAGDFWLVVLIAFAAGVAAGGADVVFPSLQADVIDWDELHTGQRKEGAYFAAWSFAAKSAGALSSTVVGFALGAIGFVPNAEQGPDVVLGLRVVAGAVPAVLYALGALLFFRFDLGRAEHAAILAALAERRQAPSSTPEASFTSVGTRSPNASNRASEV